MARKSLGTSTVEGLTVLGTQITRTIKAGANGNERPIVIVEVFWYSPDLQQLLLEDIQDPQWGRRIMGVTDIHRSEPDPALFQIPPDYTVTEVNPH